MDCLPTPVGLEDIWEPWEPHPFSEQYEQRRGLVPLDKPQLIPIGFPYNPWRAFCGDGRIELIQCRIDPILSEEERAVMDVKLAAMEIREKARLAGIRAIRQKDFPGRVPITTTMRYRVLSRDNFTCQYCGQGAPKVILVVDHYVPVAKGGKTNLENLRAACEECNSGKSDTMPEALNATL